MELRQRQIVHYKPWRKENELRIRKGNGWVAVFRWLSVFRGSLTVVRGWMLNAGSSFLANG